MERTIILIICIIISFTSYSQNDLDYSIINSIINKNKKKLELHSISFLNKIDLHSETFTKGEKLNEVINSYNLAFKSLVNDTMPALKNEINRRKVKRSFVTWDKSKIDYNNIANVETDKFYYISKPIKLKDGYFIFLDYLEMPLGGITVKLYHVDKFGKTIELVKSETILLYGLKFR